jgi:hypothetical protein
MTRIQWLLGNIPNPTESSDFYYLMDDFSAEFGETPIDNFKRYARKAMGEYRDQTSPENTLTTEITDNGLEVKLKSFGITTEEGIRKQAGLSVEEWDCSAFRVKSSQNEQNPWHSVNAEFRKKKELAFPLIQQAEVKIEQYENVARKPSDTTVNVSDLHAPMHDEKAMDISIQVMKDLYPSTVVINGDALDLTDFSDKFLASLECRNQTQKGINAVAKYIGQIRQVCPEAKIVFMEGNHSNRMRKVILKNVAGAIGLKRADNLDGYEALSVPNLLCLDTLDVEWQPYPEGEYWVNENLRFHHGEKLNLNNIANESFVNQVMGHNHKHLMVSRTKHIYNGRKQIWVASFGCMCMMDGSVPSVSSHSDWQSGFGVVYHTGTTCQPIPIYIEDGKALFEGKVYEARI